MYIWICPYIQRLLHPRLVGAHTVSAPFAVTSPVCTSSDGDDIAAKSAHAAQDLYISLVLLPFTLRVRGYIVFVGKYVTGKTN